MAAALPGVIAANTTLPVIGVPVKGSVLDGVDALYSIIQMPPGIPVATVAINGAMNAAILAVQMLALSDTELAAKFADYKTGLKKKIVKANEELKEIKFEYENHTETKQIKIDAQNITKAILKNTISKEVQLIGKTYMDYKSQMK